MVDRSDHARDNHLCVFHTAPPIWFQETFRTRTSHYELLERPAIRGFALGQCLPIGLHPPAKLSRDNVTNVSCRFADERRHCKRSGPVDCFCRVLGVSLGVSVCHIQEWSTKKTTRDMHWSRNIIRKIHRSGKTASIHEWAQQLSLWIRVPMASFLVSVPTLCR